MGGTCVATAACVPYNGRQYNRLVHWVGVSALAVASVSVVFTFTKRKNYRMHYVCVSVRVCRLHSPSNGNENDSF